MNILVKIVDIIDMQVDSKTTTGSSHKRQQVQFSPYTMEKYFRIQHALTTRGFICTFYVKLFICGSAMFISFNSLPTIAFVTNQFNYIYNERNFLRNEADRKFLLRKAKINSWTTKRHNLLLNSGANDDDEIDDDELLDINLVDDDWRTFRAKLVMNEKNVNQQQQKSDSTTDEDDFDGIGSIFSSSDEQAESLLQGMTPLDPTQWAYDSGTVIEKGAVILGGVEQDYGFGLRQQYFHKALILVLDHDESKFTKGIILNRPSDLTLDDDTNKGLKWRVWFGGDVQGFNSDNPDIVCLHTLKNEKALRASNSVMKDIKSTSFENAKQLVKIGVAKPTDFWLFCGYAGWGSGQLMGELDRKSWYMVATDSQTLLKELARQNAGADPRDAGLETWTLLMKMIGREKTIKDHCRVFDDLMLKEWARQNLLSKEAGGGALLNPGTEKSVFASFFPQKRKLDPKLSRDVKVGSLIRASSDERSPFLLEDQELHKSIILIIANENNLCIGVMLNRPAAKGLDIQITEKFTSKSRKVQVPLRYGGQFAVKGSEPLLWLHCSKKLKQTGAGAPIGKINGIWKCTSNDVIASVGKGLAKPEEFMVVSGVLVWGKDDAAPQGDITTTTTTTSQQEFEIIPDLKHQAVWDELCKQEVLSTTNFENILSIADHAWMTAGTINGTKTGSYANGMKNGGTSTSSSKDPPFTPLGGLGEGFDEEDESMVFKSDVKVSSLCNDALKNWVTTFLLGAPTLGS
jgi:putative AlgH/UPF0301 family transcriptional regulator